jgi:hypothetical protein
VLRSKKTTRAVVRLYSQVYLPKSAAAQSHMPIGRKNCQVNSLTERTYESMPDQHKTRSMLFRGAGRPALIREHRILLMVIEQAAVPLSRSCLPPSHVVSVVRGRGVLEFSRNTSTPERSTPRRAQTGFSASLWSKKISASLLTLLVTLLKYRKSHRYK